MTVLPGYPCPVCRRASPGVPTATSHHGFHHYCSVECLMIHIKRPGDLTQSEKEASRMGGNSGGQYLDQIGKFDLRDLTDEEFSEFCGRIFTGACDHLRARAEDQIPF